MSEYSIATRYDKSLLDLAIEQGTLEEVHNDMLLINKVIQENRMFALMLKNPVVSHQKKLDVLKALFKNKVTKLTISLFEVLSKRNREDILEEISHVFHLQYNDHKEISEATVFTAYPIDEMERKEFKKIVQKKTGAKTVELIEKIDRDLIGGFVLKIGDKQIDTSLSNKLKELKIKFES